MAKTGLFDAIRYFASSLTDMNKNMPDDKYSAYLEAIIALQNRDKITNCIDCPHRSDDGNWCNALDTVITISDGCTMSNRKEEHV